MTETQTQTPNAPASTEGEKEVSLGAFLRAQREMRQVTFTEITRVTKINVGILKNLESDNYSKLPSPPFVKGFLSSIGKHLGLDCHDLLLRYEQVLKTNAHYTAHRGPLPYSEQNVALGTFLKKKPATSPGAVKPVEKMPLMEVSLLEKWVNKKTIPIYVTIILVVVVFSLLKMTGKRAQQAREVVEKPVVPTAANVVPQSQNLPPIQPPPIPTDVELNKNAEPGNAPQPTGAQPQTPPPTAEKTASTSPSIPSPQPLPPDGVATKQFFSPPDLQGPQEVKVKAKTDTYLKVQIASQEVQQILLRAGETTSFSSNNRIKLLLLNAAGVTILHNNKPIGNIGGRGESKIVEFLTSSGQ